MLLFNSLSIQNICCASTRLINLLESESHLHTLIPNSIAHKKRRGVCLHLGGRGGRGWGGVKRRLQTQCRIKLSTLYWSDLVTRHVYLAWGF